MMSPRHPGDSVRLAWVGFTCHSSGTSSDIKRLGLEGVDDVALGDTGQIVVVEKRALETGAVNLGQNDLDGDRRTININRLY